MIEWRIYYFDDSTFSNLDGAHWDAPGLGVQVIVQIDQDHGWETQARDEYYVWEDRGDGYKWWGVDKFAMWEYLFIEPGRKRVLAGKRMTRNRFSEIYKRAMNDPDFPKKTAFSSTEPQP
jgi:hypothetical protein